VELPPTLGELLLGKVDVQPDPVGIGYDRRRRAVRRSGAQELLELGREGGLVETLTAVFDEPSSKEWF
jgi:hypothetical protein